MAFPYRVGIIDIGSNSIKLRIYEIISLSNHKILYEDRNMIRLGEEVFITQKLPFSAFEKSAETINSYQKLLVKFETKDIVVKATSAVREAQNVAEFVDYIYKKTNIVIDVLSGLEEANFVYLASLSTIEYNERILLLIDIGGGSTEVCIANENKILYSESLPLGTVRLKEIFLAGLDPTKDYSHDALRILEAYCEKKIKPLAEYFNKYKPASILAFGGTPYNLAETAVKNSMGMEKEGCLGVDFNQLLELYQTFRKSNPAKISKIKGLDPKRADIILAGTLILKYISHYSGQLEIMTSSKGLREGIMMEYMFKKINPNIYKQKQNDFRLDSIISLGEKFNFRLEHAQQVDKISQQIFLQLKEIHGLPEENLALLQAVSYLHDVGMAINYKDHHKHSYYLISQSSLAGFTQEEKEVIGLAARYHRKSTPKNNHEIFQDLSGVRRNEVMHLAAILRIADALDQSYEKNIEKVECHLRDDQIEMIVYSKAKVDLTLEKWSVERKKQFAEDLWNKRIHIAEKIQGNNS